MTPYRAVASIAAAACLSVGPLRAATDPALAGPYTPGVQTQSITVAGGDVLATDIHFPASGAVVDPAAGRCPLIVFGHGFSSNKAPYAGHGAHWASRGYIVLIPNMVGGSDHSRNADDLVGLVTWALAQDLDPASLLYGRIDRNAIGSSGHSAGGLSSLVAAARDPRIRATAPFDPVDNNNLGVNAMPLITVPAAITYSEDNACNANGSARVLYAAAVPVKRGVKIVGATHCDPLDPAEFACGLICGASTPARQESYRRYVTGWFEFWLRCDASYYDWVYGSHVADDVSAGVVTYAADPDPGPLDPCAQSGTPPPAVTGVRAWRSGAAVALAWDAASATPAVSEYRVYRSDSEPFVFGPPLLSVANTAASDAAGLGGNAIYFYQVRAVNSVAEGP